MSWLQLGEIRRKEIMELFHADELDERIPRNLHVNGNSSKLTLIPTTF